MLPLRRAKSTTSNYNCHQGAASYSSNFNFRHLKKNKIQSQNYNPISVAVDAILEVKGGQPPQRQWTISSC